MVGRKSEKIKTQPKTQFFPNFNGRDNKLKLNQIVIFPVDQIKKRVNKIRIYAFLVNFLNCFALILRLFPFFFTWETVAVVQGCMMVSLLQYKHDLSPFLAPSSNFYNSFSTYQLSI